MYLLVITLISFCSANILEPNPISRQLKEFTNSFNNFLQSDFKVITPELYPGDEDKINIVYKTVEEPIRIERTIPVPVVKHVPQPVPVYVPQPYPVEKEVYVPYKVYEKEHVPVIHRYPVEKSISVPIPVPVEQPVQILIPYHFPIDNRKVVKKQSNNIPNSQSTLNDIPFPINKSTELLKSSSTVSFPEENIPEIDISPLLPEGSEDSRFRENPASHYIFSPPPYTTPKEVPYGTRISFPSKAKNTEKPVQYSTTGESVQNSVHIETTSLSSIVADKSESHEISVENQRAASSVEEEAILKNIDLKKEKKKSEGENIIEDKKIIVFPTEGNDTDHKS